MNTNLKTLIRVALVSLALGACNQKKEVKISYLYQQPHHLENFFEPLHGNIKRLSVQSTQEAGDYCFFNFDGKGNMLSSKIRSTYRNTSDGKPDPVVESEISVFKPIYKENKAVGIIKITSVKRIHIQQPQLSQQKTDTTNLLYNIDRPGKISNTVAGHHHITNTYKYDKELRIIEESFFEEEDKLSTTEYRYVEFDKNRNWTKMIRTYILYLPSRKPITDTLTRKITYY